MSHNVEDYDWSELFPYCLSDRQRDIVQSLISNNGNKTKAAESLQMKRTTFRVSLKKIRTFADSQAVTGISHYDQNKKTWIKTKTEDLHKMELQQGFMEKGLKKLKARPKVKRKDNKVSSDLLNLYTLTDAHIGMLAWEKEGGANWNIDIAYETIIDAFEYLIERTPPAEVGFLNQLGDALHTDSLVPKTPQSGHVLDADSRYYKVGETCQELFERIITMMLKKYKVVKVLMAQGNHDETGSMWMQLHYSRLFRDNKRVQVIKEPSPYYADVWGTNLLGFHHGQYKNLKNVAEAIHGKYRHLMGDTTKSFIHAGHRHSHQVVESNTFKATQHPTLCAKDAYASYMGLDSIRMMIAKTYHLEKGEDCEIYYNV